MSTPIKYTETETKFIEATSHIVYDVNGSDWYYMPFWLKKVGEGLYEQYSFDQLPQELKNRFQQDRQP